MLNDESDKHVKRIWEMLLEQEIAHLHSAVRLLNKYEGKEWQQVIPNGEFPELIKLHENKDYIRHITQKTINNTSLKETYINVDKLADDADFFKYQKKVHSNPANERGHTVIVDHIKEYGKDYRYQDKEHPVKALRSRTEDNYSIGREKSAN